MVKEEVRVMVVILRAGKRGKQKGFTLVIVIIAVLISGILAESAFNYTYYLVKSEKEKELLFRGQAYLDAIKSYYEAVPISQRKYPQTLDELLSDSRFLYRRHIRALYIDPFTNKSWRLIRDKKGGIEGVVSAYDGKPLKKNNFPQRFLHFADTDKYSGWVFK